jgi:hypothetical protein
LYAKREEKKEDVVVRLATVDWLQSTYRTVVRLRVLVILLLASLLLSGCVKYDLGVNFEGPHQGAIVHHIKLGEKLTSFSNDQVQDWLKSIERRSHQLQGKVKRVSDKDLLVTIPFSSGAELESKFNQFFNPNTEEKSVSKPSLEAVNLPNFDAKFHLAQSNLLLLQRDRLSYDLDLRSLGVLSSNGNVIVSPSSLFDLQFALETPWGARSIQKAENAIAPDVYYNGHQLVWKLEPGQINHIEAVFWMPNPLGLGTVLILALIVVGFYLKYKRFPWTEAIVPPAVPQS